MTASDPPRLVDAGSGAPSELRSLLANARDDLPSEAKIHALGARLGPLLGAGAAGGGGSAAAGHAAAQGATGTVSAASATSAAKVAGLVLVAGTLVGGGAWLATRHPAPAPAAPAATHVVPRVTAATRSGARSIPRPVAPPEPAVPVPTAREPAPAPKAAARPAAPAPKAVAPTNPKSAASESEAQLLARAESALAANPAEALALTREHARRFPNGTLTQEREVIAIQALSELGNKDAARSRAKAFKARFPHSAQERKVQAALDSN